MTVLNRVLSSLLKIIEVLIFAWVFIVLFCKLISWFCSVHYHAAAQISETEVFPQSLFGDSNVKHRQGKMRTILKDQNNCNVSDFHTVTFDVRCIWSRLHMAMYPVFGFSFVWCYIA